LRLALTVYPRTPAPGKLNFVYCAYVVNTMGDTAIPLDALGAPIRLGFDKDGSVKFSKSGRPVLKVAKPITDTVTIIRQNFVANLQQYSEQVATDKAEEYTRQVQMAITAGEPIIAHDKAELDNAVQMQLEEAIRIATEEAQQGKQEVREVAHQPERVAVAVS